MFGRFGPHLAKLDQVWPSLGRIRPNSTQLLVLGHFGRRGPNYLPSLVGQLRPSLAKSGTLAHHEQLWSTFAGCWPGLAHVGQHLSQLSPISPEFGPMPSSLSNLLDNCGAGRGSLGVTAWDAWRFIYSNFRVTSFSLSLSLCRPSRDAAITTPRGALARGCGDKTRRRENGRFWIAAKLRRVCVLPDHGRVPGLRRLITGLRMSGLTSGVRSLGILCGNGRLSRDLVLPDCVWGSHSLGVPIRCGQVRQTNPGSRTSASSANFELDSSVTHIKAHQMSRKHCFFLNSEPSWPIRGPNPGRPPFCAWGRLYLAPL